MRIEYKFLLQVVASWLITPFVIIFAHFSKIALEKEFIASILIITSIYPVQIFLNEVIAPIAVRTRSKLCYKYIYEIIFGAFLLVSFLAHSLELSFIEFLISIFFSQAAIWLAFSNSKKILKCQVDSVIGGRHSSIIGAIIPLTFLSIVLLYYFFDLFGFHIQFFLYLLVVLPNIILFIYLNYGWLASVNNDFTSKKSIFIINNKYFYIVFPLSLLMAFASQYWKLQLTQHAVQYAAVCVYFISPFSTMVLIFSKSKYMLNNNFNYKVNLKYFSYPILSLLLLIINTNNILIIFFIALFTQIITFLFISDYRKSVQLN